MRSRDLYAGPPHVGRSAACWPAYMRGYVPQTLWLTETALRRRDRERQTERDRERERQRVQSRMRHDITQGRTL